MTVVLASTVGLLFGVGTYLLLQRTLTRVIIGVVLLGHGGNLLLLLAGGGAGRPPLLDDEAGAVAGVVGMDGTGVYADPLPQALALTAIVISFGATALLLALAYRSYTIHRQDRVQNDVEDRRVMRESFQESGVELETDTQAEPVVGGRPERPETAS